MHSLEKRCKKAPDDFKTELIKFFNNGCGSENEDRVEFNESPMQADPEITGFSTAKEVDAMASGDSDFAMHIGTFSDDSSIGCDFVLRSPNITFRDTLVLSFSIAAGQEKKTKDVCQSTIEQKVEAELFQSNKPAHPLFNGMVNPESSALTTMALGHNICHGGTKGLDPSSVSDVAQEPPQDSSGNKQNVAFARLLAAHPKSTVRDHCVHHCMAVFFRGPVDSIIEREPLEKFQELERILKASNNCCLLLRNHNNNNNNNNNSKSLEIEAHVILSFTTFVIVSPHRTFFAHCKKRTVWLICVFWEVWAPNFAPQNWRKNATASPHPSATTQKGNNNNGNDQHNQTC